MNTLSITEKSLTKTQKILLGVVVITFILTPLFVDVNFHGQEALALTSYDSGFEDSTSDYDADGDSEWSSSYDCDFEGSCTDDSTTDINDNDTTYNFCYDQCYSAGEYECVNNNSYHICGDYDSDGCLEWSSSYDCGYNETCSGGSCVQENTCSDQCSYTGQQECSGSNSYHICGDYDSDSCLEWSRDYSCGYNETCSSRQCVTECSSYDHQACYNDDIYWYDSCDQREEKSEECGSSQWSNNYRCSSNTLQRAWLNKGCSGASCFSNTEWRDYENCGSDTWTDEYRCSGDTVQRKKNKRGCSGSSCYNYYNWENYEDCGSQGMTCSSGECVRENQSPTADFSYNSSNLTTNDTISFNNQSSDSDGWISSYSWRFGDGNSSNQKNPSHSYRLLGNYTVRLTVTDNDGNTDSTTKTVPVGTSCSDQCSYTGQQECSSNNSYHVCGDYDSDSCLEWSSDNFCSSDETCQSGECVRENQPPTADFSYNPSNLTTNDTISFNNQSSDSDGWISSYNWSFGDGNSSNQGNPSHSYNSSGNYTVRLTVTDNDGNTDSTTKIVPVGTSCSDQCSYTGQQECSDGDSYHVCGNYDSDSCLEWSRNYYCASDETCQNGQCVQENTCSDQCSYSGQKRCSGSNNYQTCGNYDSDSCLEWSSSNSCEGSNSCGYGRCSNNQRPDWYCSGGNCNYNCNYSFSCDSQDHDNLRCYNNDVYWYDSNNNREEKYQDCGSNYCNSWGEDYCYDGNVYEKRTCYNKGCSNGSCYSNSYTDRDMVENCDSDETCQSGNCTEERECSSGACCDDGEYESSNVVCDTETKTQYGCPWGRSCGADLAKRTKTRKQSCSGNSASCTGSWSSWGDWSSWSVAESCSSNEKCSVTNESCQYSSSCAGNNNYVSCSGNDLYWFNPQGTRLSKYRDCDDGNECTVDSCSGNSCEHELKCDGSTCKTDSEDYCESCEHCGDGICNCEEDICSCLEDCEQGDLIVSISSKKSEETTEWQKDLSVNSNQNVDFLITVTNTGSDLIRDVNLQANLPNSISYKNEFKSAGRFIAGDITYGINLDQLKPETTQTFTFKGKVAGVSSDKQVTVSTQASTDQFSSSDSIQIQIKEGAALSAAPLLAALRSITRVWYGWPLIILIIILLWLALSRLTERWRKY